MSEIDIYLTGMQEDVMLLPMIDLFTSSAKMVDAPLTTQPLSCSGCRRRLSARFQDQSGSPLPPHLTVTIRSINATLTSDQFLEANPSSVSFHMWPIWTFFLCHLWKMQATNSEVHSYLIPEKWLIGPGQYKQFDIKPLTGLDVYHWVLLVSQPFQSWT